LLCKGAGNFSASEDPVYALKAAGEISESSLRLPFTTKQPRARPRKLFHPSDFMGGREGEGERGRGWRLFPFFEEALQGIEKGE